jgi:hypothetical protein
LPPPVIAASSAPVASAIGRANTSAAWYCRSAPSKNCLLDALFEHGA